MSSTDEGYIKFQADWTEDEPLPAQELKDLQHWRRAMYERRLIGAYDNGIGFGNISRRAPEGDSFIISGSGTGNYQQLGPEHYALVTQVDLDANHLHCRGPVIASSESMSHAVIYRECPWVGGVIHVHHLQLWKQLLHRVPTTEAGATYGTPKMAYSIIRLLRKTDLPERKIFVMEGHWEGVFAFGKDLEEAGAILLHWHHRSYD